MPNVKRSPSICCSAEFWLTMLSCVGLFVGLLCIVVPFATSGPLHAQCTIKWEFGRNCSDVGIALVSTIKRLGGDKGCEKGGEKCLYALKSHTEKEIEATHETPKKHYVDDLTISFTPGTGSCSVKGHSTSETWYAVLDYGTNYCNLHNLITESKLDQSPGYSEDTNNSICTQYTTANCTVY